MEENCAFLNVGGTARLIKNEQRHKSSRYAAKNWPDTLKVANNICMTSGLPVAILWGPEFSFYYNDAYADILGNKHPAAWGKPLKEVCPEIWLELQAQLLVVFAEGQTLQYSDMSLPVNRNDYIEECYCNYTQSPIYLPDGNIGGVFNVVVETTEKKISERRNRLLDDLIQHQNITQSLSSCISGCDEILKQAAIDLPFFLIYLQQPDGSYNLVSSQGTGQALEHLNWPIDSVIQDGINLHIKDISKFLKKPIIRHFPEPCTEAVIIPIKNSAAASSGFLVAGLSPRKKFGEEYNRFLKSIATKISRCFDSARSFDDYLELTHEKDNLLAVISHELKTPITAIKAYAQLAERGLIKDNQLKSAEFIHKLSAQSAKLDMIVSDMVDGTSLRSGKISIRKTQFDFDQMVTERVSAFDSEGTKHAFIMDLNVDQPIYGDQKRLQQVVSHLISNAIFYSPDHSNIEIKTYTQEGKLVFSIRDYGMGIKPEEQQKIFERFYRSVDLKQYAVPGIGLGLFISKEIIKHSGGNIWLESTPNQGSTFHFSIDI